MESGTVAEKNRPLTMPMNTGVVKAVENRGYLVEVGGCLRMAEKAVGCLVEPCVRDKVLVFADTEDIFILSVLRRESAAPVELPFEHGVSIQARGGAFTVDSPDMRLSSDGDMVMAGRKVAVEAEEGEAAIGRMLFTGVSLVTCLNTVRQVARHVETSAERVIQRVKRSYRTVEEFEESRIGRLRLLIRKSFFLASKDSHIVAKDVVKVNGGKILLG